MSPNELTHPGETELRRMNFRRAYFPPGRCIRPVVKTDPAKLPRVAEDERARFLPQDEVIVLFSTKISCFRPEFAAHSQMNSEPVVPRKHKQYLLSTRAGTEQSFVREVAFERSRFGCAEDPLFRV